MSTKVRCIKVVHSGYGVVTKNKIYKVYFDNRFRAYIIDDRPYKMPLYGHGNYFKVEEE
ncbi:hypothetical protein [Arsenophonus nasoniae]|uniref:Uncharacterized protein n=1 Tax=Arsenophonus nasoniae TaxID=638 RepID=A0AA95GBK7_9GAMM|nr:hypothetical protein [Arsenophonus nasoniae]WGL95976.1 hypothetical protein QE207_05160 [Arsenophonus nasoniae]